MTPASPGGIKKHLRTTLLAGLVAVTPLAAVVMLIWYADLATRDLLGVHVPMLGLGLAVAFVYVCGLLVTSVAGRWLLRWFDRLLERIPLLRSLYQAWKHITISGGGESVLSKVVLVPCEDGRMHMIGFTSAAPAAHDPECCCVFIPAAPNPMSGQVLFVRRSECRFVEMSVEDAFKIILSGGQYAAPAAAPLELAGAAK